MSADDLEYGPVSDLASAADALKLSFDTGDRGPFEALFGPGCVNWHNSDKAVVPAAGFYVLDGGDLTLRLDDGEVLLHPGDCVVRRATRHAWRNLNDTPVRLLVVMASLDSGQ